ncbi:hypothetical protein KR222_008274 [Zaprionus bogoriensis]|nr:hypothetical protein KR222_008274 [Zaprionus bogoriensis]
MPYRVNPRAEDVIDSPDMVAMLPYLNFLRYFRRKHPRMNVMRLLQEAPPQWDALTTRQKNLFKKSRILARTARFSRVRCLRVLLPQVFWRTLGVKYPIYDTRIQNLKLSRRRKRQLKRRAADR